MYFTDRDRRELFFFFLFVSFRVKAVNERRASFVRLSSLISSSPLVREVDLFTGPKKKKSPVCGRQGFVFCVARLRKCASVVCSCEKGHEGHPYRNVHKPLFCRLVFYILFCIKSTHRLFGQSCSIPVSFF